MTTHDNTTCSNLPTDETDKELIKALNKADLRFLPYWNNLRRIVIEASEMDENDPRLTGLPVFESMSQLTDKFSQEEINLIKPSKIKSGALLKIRYGNDTVITAYFIKHILGSSKLWIPDLGVSMMSDIDLSKRLVFISNSDHAIPNQQSFIKSEQRSQSHA